MRFVALAIEAMRQSGAVGLVDDPKHFEARQFAASLVA